MGSIQAHDFLREGVIVSDDAGQFAVGQHALCWVHAERLVHKLDTFTDQQRAAQQQVRSLIWQLYADLKDYRTAPTPWRRDRFARFDYVFCRHTGFVVWIACCSGCTPTRPNCWPCSTIQTSRSIPTVRKMTSDAR